MLSDDFAQEHENILREAGHLEDEEAKMLRSVVGENPTVYERRAFVAGVQFALNNLPRIADQEVENQLSAAQDEIRSLRQLIQSHSMLTDEIIDNIWRLDNKGYRGFARAVESRARADALEEAAKACEAHNAERERQLKHGSLRGLSEDAIDEVRAEERGEMIAASILAKRIRALATGRK